MLPVSMICAAVALPASGAGFWTTHALHNVFRDTPATNVRRVEVSAARGQTVGAQVVLMTDAPRRVLRVACSALTRADRKGAIGAGAFDRAFVEYYPVKKNSTATPPEELLRKAPADFPDAFSEARETTLEPGKNQPVWVRFAVPARAAAGDYRGEITVTLDDGALTVPVRLTVYDFAFPAKTRLRVTNWLHVGALVKHLNAPQDLDTPQARFWQVLGRTAELMRAHHQNVILTPWSLVQAARGADGTVRYDFSRFDRWVETFLNAGFEGIELGHIGGRLDDKSFVASPLPCAEAAGKPGTQLPLEAYLPALEAHLKEKGWLERAMIHVGDEPVATNLESWKQVSERVRKAAPGLRRIDAFFAAEVWDHLEVFVPLLNNHEEWRSTFDALQTTGREVWFYTAWMPQGRYPNRLIDYPLLKTRVLHWLNYRVGATGYLHWGYNWWDVPFEAFAPGDNWIVWPGKDAPRSSLRYEAMREGIEDYEYLCLLEDAAAAAAKRLRMAGFDARAFADGYCRRVVRAYQDYERDPKRLLETRDAVARAIVALRGRKAAGVLMGDASTGR